MISSRNPESTASTLRLAVSSYVRFLLCIAVAIACGSVASAEPFQPPLKLRNISLPAAVAGRDHPIDRIIDQYLAKRGLPTPPMADDATFVRRASLDLVGLLPEPRLVGSFTSGSGDAKQAKLIEYLLNQETEYAEHWLTFWNDWLRNDYGGFGLDSRHRFEISRWLYQSLLENKPYDDFARELIAPTTPESQGFENGFRSPGKLSFQQSPPMQFAHNATQLFMGINLKCASCHDSRIDRWRQLDVLSLAAVYSTEPITRKVDGEDIRVKAAWLFPELGIVSSSIPRLSRMNELSWLITDPDNGYFARTIVNRLWTQLMGRGIIAPADGIHHQPWSEGLLEYLATYLVENKFDLKAVLSHIATSQAYRSASVINKTEPDTNAPYVYAGPHAKRMTAEQYVDAIWQITNGGPSTIDASLVRSNGGDVSADDREVTAKWIWRDIIRFPDTPADGEWLVFRRTIDLKSPIKHGVAAICGDNEFEMFIDGTEVAAGDDWLKVSAVPLHGLDAGKHEIAVLVRSYLQISERSGFFFQAEYQLEDGTEQRLVSDLDWEFTRRRPTIKNGRITDMSGPWGSPVFLQRPMLPTQFVITRTREIMAKGIALRGLSPRASLMRSDKLMSTLDRPLRNVVAPSRPRGLSKYQMLELIRGEEVSGQVTYGAKHLTERDGRSVKLLKSLYMNALCRKPTSNELVAISEFAGRELTVPVVEDVLWSVFMLPEFMIVR